MWSGRAASRLLDAPPPEAPAGAAAPAAPAAPPELPPPALPESMAARSIAEGSAGGPAKARRIRGSWKGRERENRYNSESGSNLGRTFGQKVFKGNGKIIKLMDEIKCQNCLLHNVGYEVKGHSINSERGKSEEAIGNLFLTQHCCQFVRFVSQEVEYRIYSSKPVRVIFQKSIHEEDEDKIIDNWLPFLPP